MGASYSLPSQQTRHRALAECLAQRLLWHSPGGLQGPKLWEEWEINWEIKTRLVTGSWSGWGLSKVLSKRGQESAPLTATVLCPVLLWDTSGELAACPQSFTGFGDGAGSSARLQSNSDTQSEERASGGDLFPSAPRKYFLGRNY